MKSSGGNASDERALCVMTTAEWHERPGIWGVSARAVPAPHEEELEQTMGADSGVTTEPELFRLTCGQRFELCRIRDGKAVQIKIDFHAFLGSLVHFIAFFAMVVFLLFAVSLWVAIQTGTL